MLGAGAEPADEQRAEQHGEAGARAGQAIAEAGERRADPEHQRGAELFRCETRGNLQARHGADEHAAQQAERRIIEAEFHLPQRQHDIDQVGVAVVQGVGHRGNRGSPPLVGRELPCQRRKILPVKSAHWGLQDCCCKSVGADRGGVNCGPAVD